MYWERDWLGCRI